MTMNDKEKSLDYKKVVYTIKPSLMGLYLEVQELKKTNVDLYDCYAELKLEINALREKYENHSV